MDDLVGISGEQPLAKGLDGGERWSISQKDIKKLQMPHMTTEHDKAKREGSGQDQPDRTPDPTPENRNDDDSSGGQAGTAAIKQWLQDLPGDALGHNEQPERPQHRSPTGTNGRRQGCWK